MFSFSCREFNGVRAGGLIGGWDLLSIVREINSLRARCQANAGRFRLGIYNIYFQPRSRRIGPEPHGDVRRLELIFQDLLLSQTCASIWVTSQRCGSAILGFGCGATRAFMNTGKALKWLEVVRVPRSTLMNRRVNERKALHADALGRASVTQSQLVKKGDYRGEDFLVRRRRAWKMPAPRASKGIAPGSGMATARLSSQ